MARKSDTAALMGRKPTTADAYCGAATRTVEVKPINNGFIRTVSSYHPEKGHSRVETFHRKEPSLTESGSRGATSNSGSLRKAIKCIK